MERIYFGNGNTHGNYTVATTYAGNLVSATMTGEGQYQQFEVVTYATMCLEVVTSDAIYEVLIYPGDRLVANPKSCHIQRSSGTIDVVNRKNGGDGIPSNAGRAYISFERYEVGVPFLVLTHHEDGCVVFRVLKNLPTLYGRATHETVVRHGLVVGSWLEQVALGVLASPLPGAIEIRRYAGDLQLDEGSYKEFL